MTAADWEKVKASMESPYGIITLLCDGFTLTLESALYKRRLETWVYVNGVMKGSWLLDDCEERRRFMRPVKHLKWKQKALKGLSKKALKSLNIDPAEHWTSYSCVWGSFRSLKSHLTKNNSSIELEPEAP